MYLSPNSSTKKKYTASNNPYAMGDNNLHAKLKKALKVILANEYYEGTVFGQYYNKNRKDGRSYIYIDQPSLEKEIVENFIKEDSDCVKYLVGPTGIGKTTLIRNVFLTFDRKSVLRDNNLIIYVSFYSMINSENEGVHDVGRKKIVNTISTAFREAIDLVDGTSLTDRIVLRNATFYKDLYNFIKENNKLIESSVNDFNIDVEEALKACCVEKYMLDKIEEASALDYNMSLFKYYLKKYEDEKGNLFDNIILILDDVEAVGKAGSIVVEQAYHIRKCLQAYKSDRRYNIKCLLSMRNYSFRKDIPIIKEACRTYIGTDLDNREDVILKSTAPTLQSIIDKRTSYILHHNNIIAQFAEKDSYTEAAEILRIVLTKVYGKYDKMLLNLTHDNIYSSMTLLFRIVTNKKFIGKYEMDRAMYGGKFDLSASHYSFDNTSINSSNPGNKDVFYALVYGEQDVYLDTETDYYLTNIMHFKTNDKLDTELLGIYIIMYFITKKINLADEDYDGFKTINVMTALHEMMNVFDFHTAEDKRNFWASMHFMIKKLYLGGALRQSLISPIETTESNIREYSDELNVFLSTRGYQLYHMLSYNSLLLSVYRDDIDTEIENNHVPTTDMSTTNRLIYCLKYIDYLFDKEMDLFRQIKNHAVFVDTFGTLLATPTLLKGMRESITTYYLHEAPEKIEITEMYNSIASKFNRNIEITNDRNNVSYELIRTI